MTHEWAIGLGILQLGTNVASPANKKVGYKARDDDWAQIPNFGKRVLTNYSKQKLVKKIVKWNKGEKIPYEKKLKMRVP